MLIINDEGALLIPTHLLSEVKPARGAWQVFTLHRVLSNLLSYAIKTPICHFVESGASVPGRIAYTCV